MAGLVADYVTRFCNHPGGEVQILPASASATTAAPTTPAPAATSTASAADATGRPTAVSGCHKHGSDVFCMAPDGGEVEIRVQGASTTGDGHDDHGNGGDASGSNRHCHFHAGVEHCTGGSEAEEENSCEKVNRDYNIPLRVGLIFVIMATSAFGVFMPILLIRWWPARTHAAFLVLKQFGTGVIISTAFVHLYTHAQLMFANRCLGRLEYEGVTSAIVMAGIFVSFAVEYVGKRIVLARAARAPGRVSMISPETVTVLVLECGIIFHSILIGITLVVAGDSFFLTLFVVILFHQMFEGIALGSRIAALGSQPVNAAAAADTDARRQTASENKINDGSTTNSDDAPAERPIVSGSPQLTPAPFSLGRKLLLASPFALVTPVGMAIGIGVLQRFNGNNRSTILAIGTLDAVSAGILVWVGVVEMWAEDWMVGGAELLHTGPVTTLLALLGLVGGMVIMSALGKWA
ncbi:zinc/iron transporter [Magnaporthiopsis poae ATCC 64411]|uniref:Zinc/iron transporter n=1 Tax=Magnaporthiopsis poae (strain ATCC 64411 / 73-15) TaxID=644358 RepID=A0A0C4DYC3_MAGP6|nr:zinc/iron transporter [Magnaporthiopsis poae ATCC 64411]